MVVLNVIMSKIGSALVAFRDDEKGLTMVEYAIAGALVGAAVIAAFNLLGDTVGAQIQKLIVTLA